MGVGNGMSPGKGGGEKGASSNRPKPIPRQLNTHTHAQGSQRGLYGHTFHGRSRP